MRITRKNLLKIAEDTAAERARKDLDILAVFLHGSLTDGEALLGGAADIDLTFIHLAEVDKEREIVRLSEEVTLDITHHNQIIYHQRRELRQHPWLGPTVYGAKLLHDPQHFMDLAQASVRGQYGRIDHVLIRAQTLFDSARQTWQDFYNAPSADPGPAEVLRYLNALGEAANAIASLSGPPLVTRRLLLDFPGRAQAVGQPGLYAGLLGLLGTSNLEARTLQGWLPSWGAAYQAAGESPYCPDGLHSHRQTYYEMAITALLDGERPQDALWPLLVTWTEAVSHLPANPDSLAAWQDACDQLDLLGAHFERRVAGLDHYLDTIEELMEVWGREHGA